MICYFHKDKSVVGFLIRLLSNGKYDHTSFYYKGWVYEATFKGVIRTRIKEWDGKNSVIAQKKIKEYNSITEWLESQLGKKYDWLGVLSFVFRFLPVKRGRWYCSELLIVSVAKVRGKLDMLENQKVSPDLAWRIISLI